MLRKIIFIISVVFILSGCVLKPYKMDVQQGNIFDQTVTNQLQIGMTKPAVEDLLGTPMLDDPADDNWDYVSSSQIRGGKMVTKILTLQFKKGKLIKIQTGTSKK